MSTQFHTINFKCEDAFEGIIKALRGSELSTVTFFKGGSADDIVCDRIEITTDAETEVIGVTVTGNYNCNVKVAVITHLDDNTRAEHQKRVGVVGDILFRDDVLEQIVALNPPVENLTLRQWFPRRVSNSVQGKEYITTFEGDLYCQPS